MADVPPTKFPSDESSLIGRFMKVYSGLPMEERKHVIVTIDNEPISWDMAYKEINQNTELGAKIGKKLIDLGII